MRILFVQTGGTIDKDYPKTTNGWGFEISEEPAVRRLLENRLLSPSFEYEYLTICLKDSTEITDGDRSNLVHRLEDRVSEKSFDGVVITHGTDTMAETASFLAEHCLDAPPIIVTGAMRPERFSNSDADFNLGMAVAAIQLSPPGFVGICMHGLVLKHEEIDRNLETGQFVRQSVQKE